MHALHSLGYQTDLSLLLLGGGSVTKRDDCLVVSTPSNRQFFWGNFLLFPHAPNPEDYPRWIARFQEELGHIEGIEHVCFGWDTVDGNWGADEPFVAAGYERDPGIVMTARDVTLPNHAHPNLTVRPILTAAEWEAATQLQIACRAERFSLEAYTAFKTPQMAAFRRMTARGELQWYGAFEGEVQVGNLGLSSQGPVRRFQTVGTHPDHRRKGVCSRLVYEVSRIGIADGAETLVMVADEFEDARRVYDRVGYAVTEYQIGLTYRPARAPRA